MFKGKVYVYKNINGKEQEFEREFDTPQEFQSFAKRTNNLGFGHVGRGNGATPILGLGDWVNLQNYFDNLVDRKLGLTYNENEDESDYEQSSLVNLDTYEQELQKIAYHKQHKDENLKNLRGTLQKLKDYKKKFKEEGREDMIGKLDEDIKKVEEEIAKLDK